LLWFTDETAALIEVVLMLLLMALDTTDWTIELLDV
jgi:hypothetical protein